MKNEPLVSIITPVYNAENYIENTITKLQKQTYKNWEWIIVDDCSIDKTKEIIEQYQEDSRIIYVRLESNSGAGIARNKAIEKSKGKYISFLDSDDYWDNSKLEKQINFMEKENIKFSYTNHMKVDMKGKKIREFILPNQLDYNKVLKYNPFHTSSVIYNSEKLGKVYMPEIKKRQDYGLWFKILEKTEGYLFPEILSYYVQREGSLSEKKLNLIKYNWSLYRDYLKFGLLKSCYCLAWDISSKVLKIK